MASERGLEKTGWTSCLAWVLSFTHLCPTGPASPARLLIGLPRRVPSLALQLLNLRIDAFCLMPDDDFSFCGPKSTANQGGAYRARRRTVAPYIKKRAHSVKARAAPDSAYPSIRLNPPLYGSLRRLGRW